MHFSKPIVLFLFVSILVCCQTEKKTQESKLLNEATIGQIKSIADQEIVKKMDGLDINYCMGKFDPKKESDFELIPIKYADREGMYMRKDAFTEFTKMFIEAAKDGIKLQIRSATRNFDYQKGIWERKWTGVTKLSDGTDVSKDIIAPKDKALKILEYSSMPGTSRHHWGTDIDLNSFNNEYFESGEGKKVYDWLTANAGTFGFCQPYTPKGSSRPHGYNEEKWHWSYQPVSQKITNYAEMNLKNEMIQGFHGSETAPEIDVVSKYVLGINNGCRH